MTQAEQKIASLLEQIAAKLPADDRHLVTALQEAMNNSQQNQKSPSVTAAQPVLDKNTGCYQFANEPGFYCPLCFDRLQKKAPTQRLNRKLRVCSQCRTSLKPHT